MDKIEEIIIGTNNQGKYKEISDLLPNQVKKHSPKEFDILSPKETGKSFEENSFIKASYFSKKANLIINETLNTTTDGCGVTYKEKNGNVRRDNSAEGVSSEPTEERRREAVG